MLTMIADLGERTELLEFQLKTLEAGWRLPRMDFMSLKSVDTVNYLLFLKTIYSRCG